MTRAALVSALGVLISCCTGPRPPDRPDLTIGLGDLAEISERGVLRVLVPVVREAPLPRQGAPSTEERDSAKLFAERLGVDVEFVAVESRTQMLDFLEWGYGDIVMGQLTVTAARQKRFRFTRPTATVEEWLVGKKGGEDLPRRVEDLEGREIHVRHSSAFAETLSGLARVTGVSFSIVAVDESLDTETIAYEVSQGLRPLTVVDSNLLATIETYNPDLERLLVLAEGRQLAWAVRREAEALAAAANTFLIERSLTDHRVDDRTTEGLSAIRERGSIRVLTFNNPVNYFLYRGRPMGFDYEVARLAARELSVRVEMVVPPRRDLIFDWLLSGRGDVIGSTLTVTPERQDYLAFSRPYLFIEELVVQAADAEEKLSAIDELRGKSVHVWFSSSHFQTLQWLQGAIGPFDIVPIPEEMEVEKILDHVASGRFPLAVVDSHMVDAELTFRDDIRVAFPLRDPGIDDGPDRHRVVQYDKAVAFAVRKENEELLAFLDRFVAEGRGSFDFNVLIKRYFHENRRLPRIKARRAAVTGRLSPYDEIFKHYATRYGLDWRLLAAQAYQESRFDPEAESWAGAVGVFQLLPTTGLELGFEELTDPNIGIHAGVKYMHLLIERLDPRIDFKHRVRFALAAYNAGWGHLQDARRIALEKGWDENKWFGHTEKAMLLLQEPEYYRRVPHGYARGTETVRYVSEIQNRYDHYVTLVPR